MAATTSGSIKAHLEAAALSLTVHRDRAPEGATLPYVLVREGVGRSLLATGDHGDPDADQVIRELAQVELVQGWKNPATGARLERYGLPEALTRALHGAALPPVLNASARARVAGATRIPPATSGEGANLVRDVLTVEVLREQPTTVLAP